MLSRAPLLLVFLLTSQPAIAYSRGHALCGADRPGSDHCCYERPREGRGSAPGTHRCAARGVQGGVRRLPHPGVRDGGPRAGLQRRSLLSVPQQSGVGRSEHALACGRYPVRPNRRRRLRPARRAWRLDPAAQGDQRGVRRARSGGGERRHSARRDPRIRRRPDRGGARSADHRSRDGRAGRRTPPGPAGSTW